MELGKTLEGGGCNGHRLLFAQTMKPIHPLVLKYIPEISASDREKLRAGIQSTGSLIYPIILSEDQVIDGRTRQELCAELGIEPRYEEYTGTVSIPEYILQCNLRRNLTQAQSDTMILQLGREVIPKLREEAQKAKIIGSALRGASKVPRSSVEPSKRNKGSETQKRFREIVGSTDKADAVLSVINHPDLTTAVEKKEMTLKEAHKVARNRAPNKGVRRAKVDKKPESPRLEPMKFPSYEETGFPINGTMSEQDAHHRKYGRTPLHAKVVKDMLNHEASVGGFMMAVLSVTNEAHPDALSFFASLEAMSHWVRQPEKGSDWGIDFARKAREHRAILRERLPLLVKRVEELQAMVDGSSEVQA